MGKTAFASNELKREAVGPIIFLRSRRTVSGTVVVCLIALCLIIMGSDEFASPTVASEGVEKIPIWRFLVAATAIVPALLLHSPFGEIESVRGREVRRFEHFYLSGLAFTFLVMIVVASTLTSGWQVGLISGRGFVGWLGIALISGRIFGWRLSWCIPSIMMLIFIYWGQIGHGQYYWWEFSARPVADAISLGLAVSILIVGSLAYWLDQWRLRVVRSKVRSLGWPA